jgi:hypothetical protein
MQLFKIIYLLIDSAFFGFGAWSLLFALRSIGRNEKIKTFIEKRDDSANLIVRFAGVILFAFLILDFFSAFTASNDYEKYAVVNRMFGTYWFGYWFRPFSFIFLPQLLWMKALRNSKWIRAIFGILILLSVSIERLVVLLIAIDRDYLPGSWSSDVGWSAFLLKCLINVLIFSIMVGLTDLVKNKIKNLIKKPVL